MKGFVGSVGAPRLIAFMILNHAEQKATVNLQPKAIC